MRNHANSAVSPDRARPRTNEATTRGRARARRAAAAPPVRRIDDRLWKFSHAREANVRAAALVELLSWAIVATVFLGVRIEGRKEG